MELPGWRSTNGSWLAYITFMLFALFVSFMLSELFYVFISLLYYSTLLIASCFPLHIYHVLVLAQLA